MPVLSLGIWSEAVRSEVVGSVVARLENNAAWTEMSSRNLDAWMVQTEMICRVCAGMPGLSLDILPDAVRFWLRPFTPSVDDWSEEVQPEAGMFALDLDVWPEGFQSELDCLARGCLV